MKKALLLIFVGLMGYLPIQAQEQADSMCIYYRAGYRYIDPNYRNNREELDRFTRAIRLANDNGTLKRVVIQAGASPDGTQRANERLAKYRVDSLTAYLMRATGLSSNWFEKRPLGIMWNKLRDLVAASDMPDRDEVLRVLDNEPLWTFDEQDRVIGSRKKTLMDLQGGRPYKYMLREFFPDLRSSALALLYIQQPAPTIEEQPEIPEETEPEQPQQREPALEIAPEYAVEATPEVVPQLAEQTPARQEPVQIPVQDEWRPGIRVKTNAIGWAMLMVNAAVEIDISRYFSFNLPIYYSACDYFTSTAKFRMLATQPELRVWPLRTRRFFAGIHFGVASYNLALGGDWRIQDHNGTSPALGGGINIGYRIPLGRNERWNVEFSLGAGIYKAHYDKFHNGSNGAYSTTVRKTFIGLDNAAISFSYKFDLKKTRK